MLFNHSKEPTFSAMYRPGTIIKVCGFVLRSLCRNEQDWKLRNKTVIKISRIHHSLTIPLTITEYQNPSCGGIVLQLNKFSACYGNRRLIIFFKGYSHFAASRVHISKYYFPFQFCFAVILRCKSACTLSSQIVLSLQVFRLNSCMNFS
jgi:hypothetical protein